MHEQVLGRRLPLNGAGVCGAALADLGLPVELLRGFALLARAAGLLGQLAEERRRPIGMDAYLTVDRNAVYVDPDRQAGRLTHPEQEHAMATVAAVIASTHHPFYYRASTATGDEPAAVRRRVGREDRGLPGDADQGPAGRAGDGGQRPLPPALARQHAAVPGRQGAVLRRQLVQRGARVRAAADDACRARRSCPRTSCATGWTPASTSPSATNCGSTTASPARSSPCARRPTCRSCRSTRTSSRRRCRSRSGSSSSAGRSGSWSRRGRRTSGSRSSAPGTCRWSSADRASSASTVPTRSSTARPSTGSRAATSRGAWPR